MKIYLSGSHGLIGTALKAELERQGHHVQAMSRDFSAALDLKGIDAIIHLAGEPIAEGRWTEEKKHVIRESRVNGTHRLSRRIDASKEKPPIFISASAIGFYGDRDSEILTENAQPGIGFLAGVCKGWEESAQLKDSPDVRTVQLRTGIVLSKEGGALNKMLLPFKMGAGGKLGRGKQYMSWISLQDMIRAILYILKNDHIQGPVNMVAPHPVTNIEFTRALGQALHRPAILPMPGFAARMLFGEMADALLLSSARVKPEKLMQTGFSFRHEYIGEALKAIL